MSKQRHHLPVLWAADCAEHVLALFTVQRPDDGRPRQAIETVRAWARDECPVGQARNASVAAHAAARDAGLGAAQFVARATDHAVATAHMEDHAPGDAMYAMKAIAESAQRANAAAREHDWQIQQLPEEIRELVLSTFTTKFAGLKL